MKCSYYLLVLLIVFSFSATMAEIYTSADGHKFEARLIPDKTEIILGEPVFLSFEVTNLSEIDLMILDGGDYRNRLGRPLSYKLKSISTDGKEVPVPEVTMSFGGGIIKRQVTKNGGKTVIRLFLPLWSPFQEAGDYSIHCNKLLNIRQPIPNLTNEGFSFQEGTPVSLKTKIKVFENNEFKMNEIIQNLGQQILTPKTNQQSFEAVQALKFIGDHRVVAPLVTAITNKEDFFGKSEAIVFLAKFDDEDSFNAILSQINHKSNSIRSNVVIALSTSKNLKAYDYLLKLKDDEDKFVRLSVMEALGRRGDDQSIKIIKEMMQEERNKELYKFVKTYLEKPL